jgi:hypothetical protein
VTVLGRRPRRIVAALGPARSGHVGFRHRGHHLQPSPDSQSQQSLADLAANSANTTRTVSGTAGWLVSIFSF